MTLLLMEYIAANSPQGVSLALIILLCCKDHRIPAQYNFLWKHIIHYMGQHEDILGTTILKGKR